MSVNDVNNDTQTQQEKDEKILETARENLDGLRTGKCVPQADKNKMRKKIKRWFDRCRKRRAEDEATEEGKLCYAIDTEAGEIQMGRKAKQGSKEVIRRPYLKLSGKHAYIIEPNILYGEGNYCGDIYCMDYKKIYKLYREVVGKNCLAEGLLNAWDGFMSWSQMPNQRISGEKGADKSVGGSYHKHSNKGFLPHSGARRWLRLGGI